MRYHRHKYLSVISSHLSGLIEALISLVHSVMKYGVWIYSGVSSPVLDDPFPALGSHISSWPCLSDPEVSFWVTLSPLVWLTKIISCPEQSSISPYCLQPQHCNCDFALMTLCCWAGKIATAATSVTTIPLNPEQQFLWDECSLYKLVVATV